MGFPRQEYLSRLPFPSPGDLPHPGIKPVSLALVGKFFTSEPPGKAHCDHTLHYYYLEYEFSNVEKAEFLKSPHFKV